MATLTALGVDDLMRPYEDLHTERPGFVALVSVLLRMPAGAVGPTVGFGHDQILRERSENPSDVV